MKNLLTALCKAQSEFPAVHKDAVNPFHKNHYATLGAVLEAVTETLTKNGLMIIQTFGQRDGKPTLKTILAHISGETIEGEQVLLMAKEDAQGIAASSTYARRYGILAILNLSAEDDDGNEASKPAPKQEPKPTTSHLQTEAIELVKKARASSKTSEGIEAFFASIPTLAAPQLIDGINKIKAKLNEVKK